MNTEYPYIGITKAIKAGGATDKALYNGRCAWRETRQTDLRQTYILEHKATGNRYIPVTVGELVRQSEQDRVVRQARL